MSSHNRQKITDPIEADRAQKRPLAASRTSSGRSTAIERYPAVPVRCHLIADRYPLLDSEFSALISSVSSADLLDQQDPDSDARVLLLLPIDEAAPGNDTYSDNRLLEKFSAIRQAAALKRVPLVLIGDNPASLRRVGYPANTLATITNSPDGARALRRLMRNFGQRKHQRIWVVDEAGSSLSDLFECHGFDVQQVDQVVGIDSVDEGVTSRNAAEHILLISCGARCFSDCEKFPPHFESALQSNDLLSMTVILDDMSADMKPLWEERGANTLMLSELNEFALVEEITKKLYMQHQVAILHQDTMRNPSSGMYNKTYLDDCGRRLHSMAGRGSLFFAVAVVQFRNNEISCSELDTDALQQVNAYIGQYLRQHDVVAQRFPGELVFLITSSTPPGLQAFLQRLSDYLQEFITEYLHCDVDLAIGATAENGVSFDAMLHRATMAALQCQLPGSRIVLTL